MEPIKNKQAQVKKVVALWTKQAVNVPLSSSINQKRKSSLKGGPRAKRAHDSLAPSIALDSTSSILEPHWHNVGKGLMISLGPPVPLLGLVRMRALKIRCIAKEVSVKRLRNRLANEEAKLNTYKDGMQTLGAKVKGLREKLGQLGAALVELRRDAILGGTEVGPSVVDGTDGYVKEEIDEPTQLNDPDDAHT
nr:hypothetical protein CFP56_37561 [Quercus suber]